MFLARFDAEVIGWAMPDGKTPSDRPARNGDGFVVRRPGRDLMVHDKEVVICLEGFILYFA